MSAKSISILSDKAALRDQVAAWKKAGQNVALVPTMGALHEGHLTLAREAKKEADRVVVSIFVNPTQFAPNEDFDAYPRTLEKDAALLAGVGVDMVYAPDAKSMYPEGFSTFVTTGGASQYLCGTSRPGHFRGVATVVTKLFMQVCPDVALFGEKDFQQLQVIRRMAADLDFPIRIRGVAIVREADGLALSSRNAYLSPEERGVAPSLYKTIRSVAEKIHNGEKSETAEEQGRQELLRLGFSSIDYLEARLSDDLEKLDAYCASTPARVFVAARLGKTRLIDNAPI